MKTNANISYPYTINDVLAFVKFPFVGQPVAFCVLEIQLAEDLSAGNLIASRSFVGHSMSMEEYMELPLFNSLGQDYPLDFISAMNDAQLSKLLRLFLLTIGKCALSALCVYRCSLFYYFFPPVHL